MNVHRRNHLCEGKNLSPRTRHARKNNNSTPPPEKRRKRKNSELFEFEDESPQTRIKCVKFLVNHSEAMVHDDPKLYKTTIRSLLNPLLNKGSKPAKNQKSIVDEENPSGKKIMSINRVTCNGSGNDNHAARHGVAMAVKPGSGLSPFVSTGNTHACNSGLHPSFVIDLQSDGESESSRHGKNSAVDNKGSKPAKNQKSIVDEENPSGKKIMSINRVTCNGSGNDNHAARHGVAMAVKPGSGLSPFVSTGNTHACNSGLHPSFVIDLQSDGESESSRHGKNSAVDKAIFSEKGK